MRKAINFDLDTKALRQYYRNDESYRIAYKEISKFMESNGFEHRQGSGYVSLETMTSEEVVNIALKMKTELPWIKHCINKFDMTDVGRDYDLSSYFVDDEKQSILQPKIDPKIARSVVKNIKKEKTNETKLQNIQMNNIW